MSATVSALGGKVALVTGAGRGIGAALARALAAEGCRVAVSARTASEIEAVAAGIREAGGEARAFACDVTAEDQVRALVATVEDELGPIDILVNNAGTAISNRLGRVTLAEWERLFTVNATSAFLCTRAVFDGMAERGWGRVVNLASMASLEGKRYVSAYTAAKHALLGFTRALAAEAEGTGVAVSAVCPGYVDTPMTEGTIERVVARIGTDRDDALRRILDAAGQERLVTPGEVTRSVLDLLGARPGAEGLANGALVLLDGNGPAWRVDGLASPRRPEHSRAGASPQRAAPPEIGVDMVYQHVNPEALGEPRGWTNGMLAPAGGRVLFVAGQDAAEPEGEVTVSGFAEQFAVALDKMLAIVAEAGGGPEHVGRMTVFVTDLDAYRAERRDIGEVYRASMGRHFPAMALVEVTRLVDPRALVEIEATAVIPAEEPGA